ncbi:MAG TPA: glycoside hydrolase family 43 protein [Draconibacterium sp.]|nr:glycoside hydrolase family 43 protein [Draconibacterium sp.]
MKHLIIAILALLVSCATEPTQEQSLVPLGDPYILYYNGNYYAYGTNAEDGIAVYVSSDLKTWQIPAEAKNGLALHKDDVYADQRFWAPEVYFVNGQFYMYFSADEHICVAIATSPLGPFKQELKRPMIEDEKCIDNSLFIDDDGKAYLSFVRFTDGNAIWIAELEEDLVTIKKETMTPCLNVSQPWEEVWPRVNEGSFIVKSGEKYFMTYSANSFESLFYGVGFATASNIKGPWEKYENNPILQKPDDLIGVGHSAMFHDKEGQLRIVFHAHNSNASIHPRHMHIGTVNLIEENGREIMIIEKEILTPKLEN